MHRVYKFRMYPNETAGKHYVLMLYKQEDIKEVIPSTIVGINLGTKKL